MGDIQPDYKSKCCIEVNLSFRSCASFSNLRPIAQSLKTRGQSCIIYYHDAIIHYKLSNIHSSLLYQVVFQKGVCLTLTKHEDLMRILGGSCVVRATLKMPPEWKVLNGSRTLGETQQNCRSPFRSDISLVSHIHQRHGTHLLLHTLAAA